jgi:hypothetical protein
MKPTLTAPSSNSLKLENDKPLSNFGFNGILRHYSEAATAAADDKEELLRVERDRVALLTKVGHCRSTLLNPC